MPQVPEYQRQVTQSTMPDIQIPQNNMRMSGIQQLSEAQKGFQSAAETGLNTLYDQQVKTALQQNMIAVNQAKTDYINKMNSAAYDPSSGLFNTQGTNAIGITKKIQDTSSQASQDVVKSQLIGDNSVRKQAFMQEIEPLQNSYNQIAMTHEYKQTQVAAKETADASAAAGQNSVILNYDKTQAAVDPKTNQPILDANGNQQIIHQADAPFKSAINDRINYDKSIGMPQAAIDQDVRSFSTDTITKSVKSALDNHDYVGATAFLQRYGNDPTKMDKGTYNAIQNSIEKQYAPVRALKIADALVSQYGTNKTALNAAMKQFENDPYYGTIRSAVDANYSDAQAAKTQQDKLKMKSISQAMFNINDMKTAVSVIGQLQANGTIDGDQADQLLTRTRSKISAMNYKGPATPESKNATWAAGYETNGQLTGDMDTLEAYQNTVNDPDKTVTPALQKRADMASVRTTKYWQISSGGTYDAAQADAQGEQTQQIQSALYDSVETLAEKGMTRSEIMDRISPALDQLGIDKDYFSGTVEWDKLGKRKGGVQ